jgi:hypothetical protein
LTAGPIGPANEGGHGRNRHGGVSAPTASPSATPTKAARRDEYRARDQARDIVGAQGDLVAALKALDAEIVSRGAGAKAAPPAEERFVVQIEGLTIPAGTKKEIERSIQAVVMADRRFDARGDYVMTPRRGKDLSFCRARRLWPPVGLILRF